MSGLKLTRKNNKEFKIEKDDGVEEFVEVVKSVSILTIFILFNFLFVYIYINKSINNILLKLRRYSKVINDYDEILLKAKKLSNINKKFLISLLLLLLTFLLILLFVKDGWGNISVFTNEYLRTLFYIFLFSVFIHICYYFYIKSYISSLEKNTNAIESILINNNLTSIYDSFAETDVKLSEIAKILNSYDIPIDYKKLFLKEIEKQLTLKLPFKTIF